MESENKIFHLAASDSDILARKKDQSIPLKIWCLHRRQTSRWLGLILILRRAQSVRQKKYWEP